MNPPNHETVPPFPSVLRPPPLPAAAKAPRKSLWLHGLLFIATALTTTAAGAFQQGANPFTDPQSLALGVPFSFTLLLILFCHEMGHYSLARWHGIQTTLPYFIPGPPFLIGTFGAFIKMNGMPRNRAALFDVGAAGPWAGMVIALPAVAIGLSWSEILPRQIGAEAPFALGTSFLFDLMGTLVLGVDLDEVDVMLHPVAVAGWFGFFVTFLNLLPVGQLDGGHVAYALLGDRHRLVSRGFLVVLISLYFLPGGWNGWLLWALLLFFVLRVDHPDTVDRDTPLDRKRRALAWATVVIFFATFMPVPFVINETPTSPAEPRYERRYRGPQEKLLEVQLAPRPASRSIMGDR
ncbi:MAG: site-2 protease family protein [Candidatus Binatia bacterium]|nr:site-2 protease family protein [Candidatus Binatia bacterium]MDG1957454.1 site-2 protease family protein [Candidatus Binatia bacterium]MDG2009368.1 site-2 protease family protein [Candidatus Binatia bacterium]HAC79771.1 site-2 protease family protein [Deltaproteobacteria bacterium]